MNTIEINKGLVESCEALNLNVCKIHRRENELNRLIKDIVKAVISTDSIQEMSKRVYTYMKEHYGECTFGLAVNSPEERMINEFFFYEKEVLLEADDISYDIGNDSKMFKTIDSNRELIYNDTDENTFLIRTGLAPKSAYFAPLVIGNKSIGAFTFQLHKRSFFSKEELMICRELAPFLTLALNNSLQNKKLLENNVKFKKLSQFDDLTGLHNRRTFYENFDKAYGRSISRGEIPFLFLMDLDGFKGINDNFGHLAGDKALKKFSLLLSRNLDPMYIARFGGDEFIAGISNSTREDAEGLALKIIASVEKLNIFIDKKGTPLGISIGILELNGRKNLRDTFHEVDENLYKAKKNKGSSYTISVSR